MSEIIEREILARRDFIRKTREKMRDYPQLNTLIEGEETPDAMILHELERRLDHINSTPPPTELYLVVNTPEAILMDGVISGLLESAALLYARNDLAFSTGGVSVQQNQYQTYMSMSQMLYQRYFTEMKQFKVARNHQLAVDASSVVHSEWLVVSRPVGRLAGDLFSGVLTT